MSAETARRAYLQALWTAIAAPSRARAARSDRATSWLRAGCQRRRRRSGRQTADSLPTSAPQQVDARMVLVARMPIPTFRQVSQEDWLRAGR
jgi:hypothetical protein